MGIKDSLPIPKPVIRAASMARNLYWRTMRPLTFGAAVAVTDFECEKIVLIRPTYGKKEQWQLPGGGIDSAEWGIARRRVQSGQYASTLPAKLFEASARREAQEEIGVDTAGYPLIHLLNYESKETGNRDTLAIFHLMLADIDVVEFHRERSEVADVGVWDIGALPAVGASYLGEIAHTLIENRSILAD